MTLGRSLILALCLLAPLGDAAATAVGSAPLAHIATPADSNNIEVAAVTAPIAITGTASDRNLAEYELLISPSGNHRGLPLRTTRGAIHRAPPAPRANKGRNKLRPYTYQH